jgi:hypothetical protein
MKKSEKEKKKFVLDGFNPFSVTITDTNDAMFICEAMLLRITDGVSVDTNKLLKDLLQASIRFGPAEVLKGFIDDGRKKGYEIPKFVQPILSHVFSHLIERHSILYGVKKQTP